MSEPEPGPDSGGREEATGREEIIEILRDIEVPAPAWAATPAEVALRGRRRARRVRVAVVGSGALSVVAVVALAGAGLAARGGGPEEVPAAPSAAHSQVSQRPAAEATPAPVPSRTPLPATPEPAVTAKSAATPKPRPTSSAPAPAVPDAGDEAGLDLEDGTYTVFITDVDVDERVLTFDVVQFLTGAKAKDAWRADNPDAEDEGPPNDYYIVNSNLRLRTLPVADDVEVTVVHLADDADAGSEPEEFDELPDYLGTSGGLATMEDGQRSGSPYDIEVAGGQIVSIDERFVP